jgi:4-diphosphocytidyl-2C-methyl-D-erythritol kinase
MHGNQKGLEQNGLNKATVYAAVVNFYGWKSFKKAEAEVLLQAGNKSGSDIKVAKKGKAIYVRGRGDP